MKRLSALALVLTTPMAACSLVASYGGLDDGVPRGAGDSGPIAEVNAPQIASDASAGSSEGEAGRGESDGSAMVTVTPDAAEDGRTGMLPSDDGGALDVRAPIPDANVPSCDGAALCAAVLVSNRDSISGIAVAGPYLYWVEPASESLWRIPRGGGIPTRVDVAQDHVSTPFDVAVEGTTLYWTEQSPPRIASRPLGGGARTTFPATGASQFAYLTVDNGVAFASDDVLANTSSGSVYRASPASSGLFASQSQPVSGVASRAGVLAFAQASGAILTTSTTSSGPVYAGYATGPLAGIAFDGSSIYFVDYGNQLASVAVADGTYNAIVNLGKNSGDGDIAVDTAYIYISKPHLGTIYRYPKPP